MPTEISHGDILLAIGRLEGKVDGLLTVHASQNTKIEKQEGRVSSLERSRSWLVGVGATLTAFVTGFSILKG